MLPPCMMPRPVSTGNTSVTGNSAKLDLELDNV